MQWAEEGEPDILGPVRRITPLAALMLALAATWTAGSQPAPLVLDADRLTYDTAARTVEASGRVRLSYRDLVASADYAFADLQRQEVLLRGNVRLRRGDQRLAAEEVRYRLDTEEAVAVDVRALAQAAYFRARHARLTPTGAEAQDAFATLCDPASPLFHLTARRATVFWQDRLVLEDVTFWVGSTPLVTLPRYEVRIDPERARQDFPSAEAGYDALSGFWLALGYPYRVGDVEGRAYGRYNTALGLEFRNTLRAAVGAGQAAFTAGTVRDSEGRPVETLQLSYTPAPWPAGPNTRIFPHLLVGYYRERTSGAASPKAEASFDFGLPPFQLGGPWSVGGFASLRYSVYRDRTLWVPSLGTSVDVRVDGGSSAYISYAWTEAYGSTPFLFDAPTRQSAFSLGYRRAGEGLSFEVAVQYDFLPQHLRLLATVDASPGLGWRLRTFAKYNATLASFEELELRASRLCDCLEVSVAYRVPQQQLWFTVNVVPSPRVQEGVPEPAR